MDQASAEKIVGKLRASPNPLPPEAGSHTTLHWEISAEEGGEIWVAENHGPEKLVCRGKNGLVEVDWIKGGIDYVFRLYTRTEPRRIVDSVTVQRTVVGRITATPNPIPFSGESRTRLEWEITDPAIAEIYISENGAAEKLVCRGASGSLEMMSLQYGADYVFTLYTASEPRRKLDSVSVRRDDIPWSRLLEGLKAGANWQNESLVEVGKFIAEVVSRCLHHPQFSALFQLWEEQGFHVTPVHFYQPIPDTRTLDQELWDRPHNLVGIDLNATKQLTLLRDVFPRFREEYNRIPVRSEDTKGGFYLNNGRFEDIDPLIAYCMVRHHQPRQIIEVGGGYSTLLLAQAAQRNNATSLVCIEPYPEDFLVKEPPGLTELVRKKVEEIDLPFFGRLNAGDFLFIDTSHVVKIGGDVNFLFLEVLPRVKPGVIVHVHDIFLPFEYPRKWVVEERRFWTEQYLLQAFLIFNSEFEVLVSSGYLKEHHEKELNVAFPTAPSGQGGSFWMQRKPPREEPT